MEQVGLAIHICRGTTLILSACIISQGFFDNNSFTFTEVTIKDMKGRSCLESAFEHEIPVQLILQLTKKR
jgi:hypothetical protein